MSNARKRPSQRDDIRRWDNEGGAPRSGHVFHEPPAPPVPRLEPALYYFNLATTNGIIEDPEGEVHPSLQAARERALSAARALMAEGERKGEDRCGWCFEITDRANQHVLTVAFAEALVPSSPIRIGTS